MPLAYSIAAEHYIPGADWQDVRQEAMIGLLGAVRSYDPSKGHFPGFARLCITRRIWTQVKTACRNKQHPLNEAERVWDAPTAVGLDELVEDRSRLRHVLAALDTLSDAERGAVAGHLNGVSVVGNKPMDNALTRARHKLRAAA